MATEKKELLKIENLKMYFKVKGGTVKAVNDVSFDILEGETLGIVGESGCGKSTLGKTILQLSKPTEGKIVFDDVDLSTLSKDQLKAKRRDMQIIFQDPSACLNPRRKVIDILKEPFKIQKIKDQEYIEKRIIELVELVGLSEYHLSRFPHEMSGGQKQRVGIARALALNPKFIVCDEAVSALDVSVQAQVLNLLAELQKKLGLTYMFISHNLNVVHHISDRVGVMYLGRIAEIADVEQLYAKTYHPYTEALLSAIPKTGQEEKTERIILQGDIPNPANPPEGCFFHTRCSKVCDRCKTEAPKLIEVEPGHQVACHLYDK